MKYTKTVDINRLTDAQIRALPRGQWVYTDEDRPLWRGRFWGVKPSGTVVVAWQGNAKRHTNYWQYQRTLLNYARG
jgi:hypothetical protein